VQGIAFRAQMTAGCPMCRCWTPRKTGQRFRPARSLIDSLPEMRRPSSRSRMWATGERIATGLGDDPVADAVVEAAATGIPR
jgi:hypothetical protein